MLDALRQVVHLRAYAQKKPIDEYKHEAFAMFERMLGADPRGRDPDAGAGALLDGAAGLPSCRRCPISSPTISIRSPATTTPTTSTPTPARSSRACRRCRWPRPAMPMVAGEVAAPASRNAPCPCGSGRKYKHCHGAVA